MTYSLYALNVMRPPPRDAVLFEAPLQDYWTGRILPNPEQEYRRRILEETK